MPKVKSKIRTATKIKGRQATKLERIGKESKVIRERDYKFKEIEPAFVSYKLGATLNMGDYESAKIEIGLTMPCNPSEINKTYESIRKDVREKIESEIRTVKRIR